MYPHLDEEPQNTSGNESFHDTLLEQSMSNENSILNSPIQNNLDLQTHTKTPTQSSISRNLEIFAARNAAGSRSRTRSLSPSANIQLTSASNTLPISSPASASSTLPVHNPAIS